jgi:hypothetical protein
MMEQEVNEKSLYYLYSTDSEDDEEKLIYKKYVGRFE